MKTKMNLFLHEVKKKLIPPKLWYDEYDDIIHVMFVNTLCYGCIQM